ncbi:CADM1 [Mytilus edulis]|uniref:CADM1 n=1 Tax=Mytilus edulis TaxID=6550 RepID=A0A8S3Q5K8_MYTED|nr:CADM1 [Mytilus edulis]
MGWTRVNTDGFITYSDRYEINQNLPNAENLIIIGNVSTGKYDLQIFNTSFNEEGLYRCSEFTNEAQPLQSFVELKIKVPPRNITINDANTGILHGTENHPLVLNCSIIGGNSNETIMWFNDSLLLGRGGPGTFELDFIPQKYDHGRIYTCIVNSSALRISLKKMSNSTLRVNKPVFESQNEHVQNGISGMEIDIRVSVYSYPMINKVNVKTSEFSSIEDDYIDVENATDIDGTYSKYFPVNAFIITLHGFIIEENDFTSYKFWISNSLGDANYTVKLVDGEKQSSRSLNIYWQIPSSFFGGLLIGIACFVIWVIYHNKKLADNNPSSPTHRYYRPVDVEIVIAQPAESENNGSENPDEANSSDEISRGSVSVPRELHDYENSYQPLELDNSEKHLYDETQVLCSTNIVSTGNTYVNTVL